MRNPKYRSLLLAVCLALFATCPVFAAEIDRTVQVIQVEEAGDTYWVEMTPGFTRLRERESVVAVALGGEEPGPWLCGRA